MIYTVLMLSFIMAITLLGTITSTRGSYATFQTAERGRAVGPVEPQEEGTGPFWHILPVSSEYEAPPTVTAQEGAMVGDWVVEKIEPRVVTVSHGKTRYRLDVGDSPGEGPPLPPPGGVERHGDDVVMSAERRDDIATGVGLIQAMMAAASVQVPGVGFQLLEIDKGSIFDQVGLRDGDVVMELDGEQLTDPWTAVQALRRVAKLDRFTVRVLSTGGPRVVTVRIR